MPQAFVPKSFSLSVMHTSKRCVPKKKKKRKKEEKKKKKKKKKCVYDQTHIHKNWERCAHEFSRLT